MGPVVAKYGGKSELIERQRAVFQQFLGQSSLVGLGLTAVIWLVQDPLAQLLNIPAKLVPLIAVTALLALVRPVITGLLQGQERFIAFGLVRTLFAIGRLLLAVVWIGWWGGTTFAAVAVLPLGLALSFMAGLLFLGRTIWQAGLSLPDTALGEGWRLSLAAFLTYAIYMSFLSLDLVWVNRYFAPELAGGYASAVVLRRVIALLPGVAVVILYPRLVAWVKQGLVPDKLLWRAGAVVVASGLVITAVYFLFASTIIQLVFGPAYVAAAPVLGWMGVAMVGFGLGSIWLNLYLATWPWPFVIGLTALLGIQLLLLNLFHATLMQVTAVFALTGWVLAIGGLVLYLFWLRPRLMGDLSTDFADFTD
jgi:O-antigen/teichoic acid export membrane protein